MLLTIQGVDAGARNIEITVDLDQLSFVIKDDGHGILPDDLSKIGTLHYTSKMRATGELRQINTFGFRGQALHSIAAISTMTIISKTHEYNASFFTSISNSRKLFVPKMITEDSKYYDERPTKNGTIVIVQGLFSNLPVRKTQAEKISHYKTIEYIRSMILQCAIASPDTRMVVYNQKNDIRGLICKVDGATSLSFHQNVLSLMNSIYGISMTNHHQHLQASYQEYKVTCIIGKIPTQSKSYQFIMWNKRMLKNHDLLKEINKLFMNADFGSQLDVLVPSMSRGETSPKKGKSPTKSASSVGSPYSRFPAFLILIEGPMSVSDLLQDPTKDVEISKHLDVIVPLIMKVMKSFLKSNNYDISKLRTPKFNQEDLVRSVKKPKMPNNAFSNSQMELLLNSKLRMGKVSGKEIRGIQLTGTKPDHIKSQVNPSAVNQLLGSNRDLLGKKTHSCDHHALIGDQAISEALLPNIELSISREILQECQVISQVDTKFILLKTLKQTPRLFIVDQHACDERIKIEQWLRQFIDSARDPFHDLGVFLDDQEFDLEYDNMEIALLEQYEKQCNTWGIKFEVKERNMVTITHLPEILISKIDIDQQFLKKCISQYLHDLHDNIKLKSLSNDWWSCTQALPTIIIDLLNSKACRSAIMFGKKLTNSECEQLIKELSRCKLPFQCAHGRPSIVPLCDLSSFDT